MTPQEDPRTYFRRCIGFREVSDFVVPANPRENGGRAGIQEHWIPAVAGTTLGTILGRTKVVIAEKPHA